MEKLNNIQTTLNQIQQEQGSLFTYNESKIIETYTVQEDNKGSMSIKILSILGGMLATLFFTGFLAIAGLYNSEIGMTVTGSLFVIAALGLNKWYPKTIIDTFCLSLYLVGLCMLGFGWSQMDGSQNSITALIAGIAILSLIIHQNYMLSFVAAVIAINSLLWLLHSNHWENWIHVNIGLQALLFSYFFLNEAKILSSSQKLNKLYEPLKAGILISFLTVLGSISRKNYLDLDTFPIALSSIVFIPVLFYLVHLLLKTVEINMLKHKLLVYVCASAILIPLAFTPYILGALLIILICFKVNYKTGFVSGIIALIYFMSQFYYDLNLNLLHKSFLLFGSGMVFLLFYVFINSKNNINEKI